jgi:hypothetical protein
LPIFGPYRAWLERLPAGRLPRCEDLNALTGQSILTAGGALLRFVEPDHAAEAYELRVLRSGEVMTRPDNWHDVFNALAWMTFPRTKALLNARHCDEIRSRGITGARGTVRDVLSLFDEGGAIVASSDAHLLDLIRRFDWKTLFWERRNEVMERMRFFVFGHALLEAALDPYKGATAKALLLDVAPSFMALACAEQLSEVDERTAAWFARPEATRSTRTLSPLPIMGIPGWADNGSAAFYDDTRVFRPGYSRASVDG